MSIREGFEEFKGSHPEVTIGKSPFFSVSPQHVLPVADTPHNVCVCKYHSNCINLISICHIKEDYDFEVEWKFFCRWT